MYAHKGNVESAYFEIIVKGSFCTTFMVELLKQTTGN